MSEERKDVGLSIEGFFPKLRQYASSLTLAQLNSAKQACLAAEAGELKEETKLENCNAEAIARLPSYVIAGLGPRQDAEKLVGCVEKTLMTCRDEVTCQQGVKECVTGSAYQQTWITDKLPYEFMFRTALERHLRKTRTTTTTTTTSSDNFVKIPLTEIVKFGKEDASPKTESASSVFFEKTSWDKLFGKPSPQTQVPPAIAGLIVEIFETNGESKAFTSPIIDYVEHFAWDVLNDPAFASLREYLQGRSVPVDAF